MTSQADLVTRAAARPPLFVLVRLLVVRLAQAALLVWFVVTLFFIASRVMPGDPIRAMFGFKRPPPELLAELHERYLLDRSLWVQYWDHVGGLLHLDFGVTYRGDRPVGPMITAALKVSLRTLAIALPIQVAFGALGGMLPRMTRSRFARLTARMPAAVVASIPVFVIAHLVRVLLVEWGVMYPSLEPGSWQEVLLPGLILGTVFGGYVALVTDDALGEQLQAPHVGAARGRGITPNRILRVHALRPALPPVITLIGINMAQVVTSLLIVELVLGAPGLGTLMYEGIRGREHDIVVGVAIVGTGLAILASTLTDVVVAAVDPRITR